jgi:hypothetical protein
MATLVGSILDNVGGDCGSSVTVTSHGHNIDSDGTCGLTDPTDLPNTDPMLGPLQDNGGPTWTHALQLGSPAIDAIPVVDCAVAEGADQRGVRRPLNGDGLPGSLCDIGAYEVAGCADGLDNDGDERIDFDGGVTAGLLPGEITAPDPNCASAVDNTERRRCGLGYEVGMLLLPLLWLRRRTDQLDG